MEQQQLFGLVHIVFAYLAFILLITRAFPILIQRIWQEKPNKYQKIFVGFQHLSYCVVVASGIFLLWKQNFEIESWFYAKMLLFFVLLSASAKAFRRKTEILLVQRQAGLIIATIAYCAIFGLVFLKPNF